MNSSASRFTLIAAFSAVYLIWGSTYIAIKFAIVSLPPFLMAAIRFAIAGSILYIWRRLSGIPSPSLQQWREAAVIGAFLLLGGNGGVVWAEQYVPSGLTALLIATEPMWIVVLSWFWYRSVRPNLRLIIGLVVGLVGMILLVGPAEITGGESIHIVGALAVLLASLSWAIGSLRSSSQNLQTTPFMLTAMQMLTGSVWLAAASLATGEWSGFNITQVTLGSWLALSYLIVFGAIVAFSAYIWILRNVAPGPASTYAFVNPVIAVFLGWLLGGEQIGTLTLVAAAFIVTAVFLIITDRSHKVDAEVPADSLPEDWSPARNGRTSPRLLSHGRLAPDELQPADSVAIKRTRSN